MKVSKAPGIDKVHNSLVKKLPPIGFLYLALIINACLKLNYFPSKWKHANVIPIKKPGKPAAETTSYRPISLLNSLSKILERIILKRLQDHLAATFAIPDDQHGFQKGKSTVTQLQRLITTIRNSLNNRLSTGMLLVDVEKAFDRVWLDGLVFKLISMNVPHYLVKIINSFLRERSFHVTVDGKKSGQRLIHYGVPQGAVLSPTLYNIYTSDFPELENCSTFLFADDTAITVSSRFCKFIEKNLKASYHRIKKYCCKWKISLNDSKTQCIFFTRRRTKQIPTQPLQLGGVQIDWQNVVKYLGVQLDKRLTFRQHIQYAPIKTQKAIRILYSMLCRNSKMNTRNKRLVYKTCIRPVLLYAAPILNGIAATHIKHMQIVQNKCLRMITNSPPRTRTQQLHEDIEIEFVTDFIHRLTEGFEARHGTSRN